MASWAVVPVALLSCASGSPLAQVYSPRAPPGLTRRPEASRCSVHCPERSSFLATTPLPRSSFAFPTTITVRLKRNAISRTSRPRLSIIHGACLSDGAQPLPSSGSPPPPPASSLPGPYCAAGVGRSTSTALSLWKHDVGLSRVRHAVVPAPPAAIDTRSKTKPMC